MQISFNYGVLVLCGYEITKTKTDGAFGLFKQFKNLNFLIYFFVCFTHLAWLSGNCVVSAAFNNVFIIAISHAAITSIKVNRGS